YYHAYHFEIITAGWVVLVKTGSPVSVGLVGFCRTIPMFAFGLILGAAADRFRRTDVLLAVQILGLSAAMTLAVLFSTGAVRIWQIYLITGLLGCAWATDFSTRRALISELHPRDRIVNALSLESMSMQGNKIFATLLSGLFLAVGGATLCYWWLTTIYGLNLFAILRLRHYLGATQAHSSPHGVRLAQLVRGGWSVAIQTPIVLGVLLITVVMNLLVFPYQQMLPVIARDLLHVGPKQLGLLAGADGIGAIIVGAVLTRRAKGSRHGVFFLAGAFCVGILVVVLALSRVFALSWGTQVTLGLCSGAFGAMQPVLILNNVEVQMRARAMGMLAMAIGVGPFGILFTGVLSSLIGPAWTISGMALLALVLMAAVLTRSRSLFIA
ncbi:MAG: MFS transporter, partial [Chloroflexota bacterium]|nr:MFS transporter [Chloroflexota bacterium]